MAKRLCMGWSDELGCYDRCILHDEMDVCQRQCDINNDHKYKGVSDWRAVELPSPTDIGEDQKDEDNPKKPEPIPVRRVIPDHNDVLEGLFDSRRNSKESGEGDLLAITEHQYRVLQNKASEYDRLAKEAGVKRGSE